MEDQDADVHGFQKESRDLLRATTGGLIFGTPLLYTMEIWHNGEIISYGALIILLIFFLILNIAFSYIAGLREEENQKRWVTAIEDGVTSVGLSVVISLAVLALIGQIHFVKDFTLSVSKVILEACIVSVGVSFTNLKVKQEQHNLKEDQKKSSGQSQSSQDLLDIVATAIGAFTFSFNVAPTEEIVLIASKIGPLNLAVLILAEITLCYMILYGSGLKQQKPKEPESFFQRPMVEVLITTSISLLVAFILLAAIGFDLEYNNVYEFVPSLIVLGLPAVVGGAAGRLVI